MPEKVWAVYIFFVPVELVPLTRALDDLSVETVFIDDREFIVILINITLCAI